MNFLHRTIYISSLFIIIISYYDIAEFCHLGLIEKFVYLIDASAADQEKIMDYKINDIKSLSNKRSIKDKNKGQKEINDQIDDLISQFAAVINTRDGNTINKFMNFYADSSATFVKKILLFDPHIQNKIIAEQDISLTKEEYIAYMTSLVASPMEYAIFTKIQSIDASRPYISIVSVNVREAAISKINTGQNKISAIEKTLNTEAKIKTLVNSQCNFVLRQSATMVINGMNCIEKIIIY